MTRALLACYLCSSSAGELRELGACKVVLCASCRGYVVKVAEAKRVRQ